MKRLEIIKVIAIILFVLAMVLGLTIGAFYLGRSLLNKKTMTYTMSEVMEHSTKEDCYLIVDNKVYNPNLDWTAVHPGGSEVFDEYCGTDITPLFVEESNGDDFSEVRLGTHSKMAMVILELFYIGDIRE